MHDICNIFCVYRFTYWSCTCAMFKLLYSRKKRFNESTAIYKLISLVSLSSLCRVGSSHPMQLQLSHIASMIECFIMSLIGRVKQCKITIGSHQVTLWFKGWNYNAFLGVQDCATLKLSFCYMVLYSGMNNGLRVLNPFHRFSKFNKLNYSCFSSKKTSNQFR